MITEIRTRLSGSTERSSASGFAKQSAWALAGEISRVVTSALVFLLSARMLGSAAFGEYSGAIGLTWMAMPFATLGYGHLLVMRVSRSREALFSEWCSALTAALVGAAMLTAVCVGVTRLLLPSISPRIALQLALAEVLSLAVMEMFSQVAQAHDEQYRAAIIRALGGVLRLLGLLFVALSRAGLDLERWAGISVGSAACAAVVGLCLVKRWYSLPFKLGPIGKGDVTRSLPFAFGIASFEIQDDIDKTLLLRYGQVVAAGTYSAGYRFASFAFIPVRAVLVASYSRFFAVGVRGLDTTAALAKRLMLPMLVYGGLAAVALLVAAPLVSVVLGDGYRESVPVIRALAFFPMLRTIQYLGGNALTGAGYIRTRTACTVGAAALNIGLNVLWIRRLSWRGSIAATLCSEAVFTFVLWLVIWAGRNRERSGRFGEEVASRQEVTSLRS